MKPKSPTDFTFELEMKRKKPSIRALSLYLKWGETAYFRMPSNVADLVRAVSELTLCPVTTVSQEASKEYGHR